MTVLDQFRLDDRVALVTGGAGGIGTTLAEAGADVCLADVDEPGLAETADRLRAETDAAVETVVADVSDPAAVETAVDRLGGLDVAFANAGVGTRGGPVGDYDLDVWESVTGTNLRGVFLTNRAAAAHMVEGNGGVIVNTASILGVSGTMIEGLAAYTAAKGGVVQLTRQLAGELAGDGVRVNALAPGYVDTAMTREELAEMKELLLTQIPAGRVAQPADLKGPALALASDATDYVTGEVVLVDGGMNAV